MITKPTNYPITLVSGWNYLSTPMQLATGFDTLDKIFDAANQLNIDSYMFLNASNTWVAITSANVATTPLTPLTVFAVHVKAGLTATAVMVPSTSQSLPATKTLQAGINLVGPSPASLNGVFSPEDLATWLGTLGPGQAGAHSIIVINPGLGIQGTGWTWITGQPTTGLTLQPFSGYWVIMDSPVALFGLAGTPLP